MSKVLLYEACAPPSAAHIFLDVCSTFCGPEAAKSAANVYFSFRRAEGAEEE